MKNINACAVLALTALCFLSTPIIAYADSVNSVTLTIENVGPGNQTDGYYTYPYNLSVNGSTSYTSMMCLSFNNEITLGESWTADVYSIPAADALIGNNDYAYAAWLFDDAETATVAISNEDQLAAWGLFADNVPGSNNPQLTAAEATPEPSSFYTRFEILIPVAGTQSEGGLPQTFVQDPPATITPEPNSLVLLGSGLLGCAGFVYRKRRQTRIRAAWRRLRQVPSTRRNEAG